MTSHYLLFFFALSCTQHCSAQSSWSLLKPGSYFGLYALDQNQQCNNPAAFDSKKPNSLSFHLHFPVSLSDVLAFNVQASRKWQNSYFFHQIGSVFHPAQTLVQLSNGLALPITAQLQFGITLEARLFIQPNYYGNFFELGTKMGLTYQFNSQHILSIVLDDIQTTQNQTLRLEHLWCPGHQVQFAQGMSWNPSQKPIIYLGLVQYLQSYRIHFAANLPLSHFQFSFSHSLSKKWDYQLTQSWQVGLGYLLQFTLLNK
jgi:hypothetical protein